MRRGRKAAARDLPSDAAGSPLAAASLAQFSGQLGPNVSSLDVTRVHWKGRGARGERSRRTSLAISHVLFACHDHSLQPLFTRHAPSDLGGTGSEFATLIVMLKISWEEKSFSSLATDAHTPEPWFEGSRRVDSLFPSSFPPSP